MTAREILEAAPAAGTFTEADEIQGLHALRVVPDWNEQLTQAEILCRLVDQHLNYEAKSRLLEDPHDFHAEHLCPEQRIQMISDLYGATR
jgi:hypothetical protein